MHNTTRLTQSLLSAAASHRHPQRPAAVFPGQTHMLRMPSASPWREMGQTGSRASCSPPAVASLSGWIRSLPSPPASLVQLQPPLCSPSGCWQEKTAGGSQPWIPPDLPPSTAASERHRAANAFGSSAPTAVVLWSTEDHRQRLTVGLERQRSRSHKHTWGLQRSLSFCFSPFFLLLLLFFN